MFFFPCEYLEKLKQSWRLTFSKETSHSGNVRFLTWGNLGLVFWRREHLQLCADHIFQPLIVRCVFSIWKALGLIFRNCWIPKVSENQTLLKPLNSFPHQLFLKVLAMDSNSSCWNLQQKQHDFRCLMRGCVCLELVYDPSLLLFSVLASKIFQY